MYVAQNEFKIQIETMKIDLVHKKQKEDEEYPKKISEEITIYLGPHGYYIKYKGSTKSLPNDTTKHTLTFCEQLFS